MEGRGERAKEGERKGKRRREKGQKKEREGAKEGERRGKRRREKGQKKEREGARGGERRDKRDNVCIGKEGACKEGACKVYWIRCMYTYVTM